MNIFNNKNIITLILSVLAITGIYYINHDIYSILIVLLPFIYYYLYHNNSKNRISNIYSVISSIIFIIGKEVYDTHTIDNIINKPILYILYFIGLSILFYHFFETISFLFKKLISIKFKKIKITNKEKKIGILTIISTHLITYLAYYPGLYNYDIITQAGMITGKYELSNFHPIMHTLIWELFYTIEQDLLIKDISIVLYTLFQLICVIGTYLYIIKWLENKKLPKYYLIGVTIYYALNPILLVFSLSTTKDVFFGISFLLLITSIYDLCQDHTKINKIKYTVLGILCSLFRNNMIYAFIGFFIILFLFFKKEKIHYYTAYIILVMYIFESILLPIMEVKPTLMQEKMSIPLTQLSYIYLYEDTYTEKEKEIIKEYVPYIDYYNPRFADNVKYAFNEKKYKEDSNTFIKLYLKGFKNHPLRYITIFLDMNIPYWYINASSIDPYSEREYIEDTTYNRIFYRTEQKDKTKLKSIYNTLHSFASYESIIQKLPIIGNYFLLSFSFIFMLLYSYIYCINRKDKSKLIILILLLLLYMTYLLGPVSNFRYVYPYYLGFPLYIGILFIKERRVKNEK